MPCLRPLNAYRAPGGGVAFNSKEGYADLPLTLPCGQCMDCRRRKAAGWAARCVHEAQLHEANSFVTLTYDDDHLPPDGGLVVRDWQTFAKRLRKVAGPFRYFHVGEYGEENLRPHYHALIFGLDFTEDRYRWSKNGRGEWLYRSPLLEERWGNGFCLIGELTYDSAAYTARYCMKKVTGPAAADHYSRFDPETGEVWQVKPEYLTMSRHPGLASKWFEQYKHEIFPSDEVIIEAKKFRPPRYYDEKLNKQDLNDIKNKRISKAKKWKEELTPQRLRTRETWLESITNQKRRTL